MLETLLFRKCPSQRNWGWRNHASRHLVQAFLHPLIAAGRVRYGKPLHLSRPHVHATCQSYVRRYLQGSYLKPQMAQPSLLTSINVESNLYFRLLASIGVLGGREEGAGWWAWEHSPGRGSVGLEGAVRTGDLTSSIRVLKITPRILTCKFGVHALSGTAKGGAIAKGVFSMEESPESLKSLFFSRISRKWSGAPLFSTLWGGL